MFLFDDFVPGKTIGSFTLKLEHDLLEEWLEIFPEDRDGARMPPGMMAAVHIRAYAQVVHPRPPGNVHGKQVFRLAKLPEAGQDLCTTVSCERKELKGERRWVTFSLDTRGGDGKEMFSGLMTALWAK